MRGNMEELKNFTFKKKFGQNFILDNNFLNSLVDSFGLSKDTEVLEIGPGAGTLTMAVANVTKKVCAYEIDKDLKPVLEKRFEGIDNIDVTFRDILDVSLEEVESKFSGNFSLVANIPYYITSPIIFKFLESEKLDSMFLMVQLEVGERFASNVGSKEYGIPSVLVASKGKASVIKKVNRKMFYPVPNVDSCILKIEIDRNKFEFDDWKDFSQFVQNSFSMRRKTLVNNLSQQYKISKEEVKEILSKLNLSETVRPENLTVENYVSLYEFFKHR